MKYIERGWLHYRAMVIPADASEIQVTESRQAFFAGAAILFTALTHPDVLDPGLEATDNDLMKMADLQAEIDAFGQELDKKVLA
jgi:hypothetical protein